MTATYNTKLGGGAFDAGKEVVDSGKGSGKSRTPRVPSPFRAMRSNFGPGAMPEGPGPVSPDQPTFFRAAVTFTATYSNKYYMEGTA